MCNGDGSLSIHKAEQSVTLLQNPYLVTSEACTSFNPNSLHNVCHLATRSYVLTAGLIKTYVCTQGQDFTCTRAGCALPPLHTYFQCVLLAEYRYVLYIPAQ